MTRNFEYPRRQRGCLNIHVVHFLCDEETIESTLATRIYVLSTLFTSCVTRNIKDPRRRRGRCNIHVGWRGSNNIHVTHLPVWRGSVDNHDTNVDMQRFLDGNEVFLISSDTKNLLYKRGRIFDLARLSPSCQDFLGWKFDPALTSPQRGSSLPPSYS